MDMIKKVIKSNKTKPKNLFNSIIVGTDKNKQLLKWSSSKETENNFGDALNPWLYNKITNKKPINSNDVFNITKKPVYSCIGSILDNSTTNNLVVWGSGFKEKGATFKIKPKKILAVRGPLTRENVLNQNIECPEVYGDPALLLPLYYYPKKKKKYKLGIIAHYVDKNNLNYKRLVEESEEDVLIIDIEDQIENVVDNILQCEKIASSSLHGVIVADAYSIPSLQLKISNNIVGNNFKFKDYMASVNRPYRDPFKLTSKTSINEILSSYYEYAIDFNPDNLLKVCPFIE